MVGIIKTHDSAVVETFKSIKKIKTNVIPLVDGDAAGDKYIKELAKCDPPPKRIIQWPANWVIEDIIGWIVEGDPKALSKINSLNHIEKDINSVSDLANKLKTKDRSIGGLKSNYLAYDDIASEISGFPKCVDRTVELLTSLLSAINTPKGKFEDGHIHIQTIEESIDTVICRWLP